MAADAASDRLAGRTVLEMTDVTSYGSDSQMCGADLRSLYLQRAALHDLRVAAGAAESLPALEVSEVLSVIEADAFVGDLALKLAFGMTTGTQTGRVLDFGPRLHPVRAGDVLDDLIRCLDLPHRLRFDPRRIVTLDTLHRVVGRCSPGVIVGLHDVAIRTEARMATVLDETHGGDRQQDHSKDADLDRDLERAREVIEETTRTRHAILDLPLPALAT